MLYRPGCHGLGEWAYSSFRWPTAQDYTLRMGAALSSLSGPGEYVVDDLAPPVQTSYHALVAAVQLASGLDIGSIVSGAVTPAVALRTQEGIGGLVASGAQFVVEAGSQALAEELAEGVQDASEVVPVLGKLVSIAIGVVADVFKSYAHATERCSLIMQLKADDYCRDLASTFRVAATTHGDPTPADHFRQVAFSYQAGDRLPPIPASMYVAMCGGETDGFGFASDAQYRSWLSREMSPIGEPGEAANPGIEPVDVRRRMWKLIQGIMAAAEPTGRGVPPTGRDQGRSLMPILQEIVRQQSLRGRLPVRYLNALSKFITHKYDTSYTCEPEHGSNYSLTANCSEGGPRIDLVPTINGWIDQWDAQLYDSFWDAKENRWRVTPIQLFLRQSEGWGVFVVDEARAKQLMQQSLKAEMSQYRVKGELTAPSTLTPAQGVAVGAGALGIGYAGWTLAKILLASL